MLFKAGTPIYKIIHIKSLNVVLESGSICSKNAAPDNGFGYHDIADFELQFKRGQKKVPLPPYGTLHDYVPFYFCPRTPMMYSLLKNGESKSDLIYLITYVETIKNAGCDFVFTDGHAMAKEVNWFNDFSCLKYLDWECINNGDWGLSPSGREERRIKKQAEFLVSKEVPFSLVDCMMTKDWLTEVVVEVALMHSSFDLKKIKVMSEPNMFF